MKRVNFRSFIYSSLVLILAIFSCLVAMNIMALGIILLLLTIFVPVSLAVVFKKRLKPYIFVTVIMTAILCVVSSICFFVRTNTWLPHFEDGTHSVEGVIDDLSDDGDGATLILTDLSIDGKDANGRLSLTITGAIPEWLSSGDILDFEASVRSRRLITGFRVNASYLRSDIRYQARIAASSVKFSDGTPKFSVSNFIKGKLIENMGSKYGAIAFGMLTGDKNEISDGVIKDFSASGIAHILAVSGLHIGVLAGIVSFILRRLRVKRLPTFLITSATLIAYAALAGFSPSVVRACVMYGVGGGAMLLGEQNDGFNSLGVAATVVLAFSPLMLFETGFIMSVGAVFGILNFSPMFVRGLKKIKLNKSLASAISVTVSAQLGILPSMISVFGYIQTYSIIINIIMLPFMSFAFIAVFVALLLSLIPPLGFVLKAASVLIRGMTVGASLGASLPYAQINVATSGAAFLLYPVYFIIGDFVNVKKVTKLFFLGLGVLLILLLILFA